MMAQLNVQLLLTGNELMTGDIVDSNSAMIAQSLKELGLEIKRKVTVADELALLVDEIKYLSKHADILIINGGLGPTVDDLTAQALATAASLPLIQHPEAFEHLKTWCQKRNAALNTPNLKQTILPEGCNIIANNCGSAVGFHINFQDCDIYCTPGVPHELKTMIAEQITPLLTDSLPDEMKLDITRLQVFGLGESSIQKLIDDKLPLWPTAVELGFRAGMPLLEVKLTTKSSAAKKLKQDCLAQLHKLLGDHIVAEIYQQPKSLAEQVISLLAKNNLKITLAESCTGGLIASLLTQVQGASKVFEAGYVSYSNKIKTELLAVNKETLEQYGAVSKATVIEMAQGALKESCADMVIAVSGIAGPDGGTEEKPVGTVCIAWGGKNTLQSQCLLIPAARVHFQKYTAAIGLDLIRRLLINSHEIPSYIIERSVK